MRKNKFRIISVLISMLLVLGMVGCSVEDTSASSEDNGITKYYVGNVNFSEIATFQDDKTGVWYYVVKSHSSSNATITPRYNADGTLYTGN